MAAWHHLVRSKERLYVEPGVAAPPPLINRAVVITGTGTRQCRPPERGQEIL